MPRFSGGLMLSWLLAAQEAGASGSEAIEPEHFLAGLTKLEALADRRLSEGGGSSDPQVAAAKREGQTVRELFRQVGVDPDGLRRRLRNYFPAGVTVPEGKVALHRSERSRRVFEEASRLARKRGERILTSLHLLWAIVKEAAATDGAQLPLRLLLAPQVGDLTRFAQKVESAIGEVAPPKSTGAELAVVDLGEALQAAGAKPTALRIGRPGLFSRLLTSLASPAGGSVLLLGLAGTGRKTLALLVARELTRRKSGAPGERLWPVTPHGSEFAGCVGRERSPLTFKLALAALVHEEKLPPGMILFVTARDLLNLVAVGGEKRLLGLLRRRLAAGELRLLLVATPKEFCQLSTYDPYLPALLDVVVVPEFNRRMTRRLLAAKRSRWQAQYGVTISPEAVEASVVLSQSFLPEEGLPGQALRLLETTCKQVRKLVQPAEGGGAFGPPEVASPTVTAELVAQVVALETGREKTSVLAQLLPDQRDSLAGLEDAIIKRVIGHSQAIEAICRQIRLAVVGLAPTRRRPVSFLMVGPPGVGKTHLARAFATAFWPADGSCKRLDLSPYRGSHALERLFGRPPGAKHVGRPGSLVRVLRGRMPRVVVLEHVEKAGNEVRDLLARLISKGYLHDPMGRLVDISDCVIFACITERAGENCRGAGEKEALLERACQVAPELLPIVDETIVLETLSAEALASVAGLWARRLQERLERAYGKSLTILEEALELIAAEASRLGEGGHSLRRLWKERILDPLGKAVVSGKIGLWEAIEIAVENGTIECLPTKPKPTTAAQLTKVCCDCGVPVPPGEEDSWRWLEILYLCPDCRRQLEDLGRPKT
ncbi:MAG: AAA family ATPase [Thermoguttaceae bacterium]|nr:AAA family ATPase [Thermoguttaceae bacterium]MDW8079201.1 AAA family ATPase [Thermoguttaceae bacterium]